MGGRSRVQLDGRRGALAGIAVACAVLATATIGVIVASQATVDSRVDLAARLDLLHAHALDLRAADAADVERLAARLEHDVARLRPVDPASAAVVAPMVEALVETARAGRADPALGDAIDEWAHDASERAHAGHRAASRTATWTAVAAIAAAAAALALLVRWAMKVTVQSASLAAARREEARLRRLVEEAHDIVVVVGDDGGLLFASPSLTRVLGYAPSELGGLGGLDLEMLLEQLDRAPIVTIPHQHGGLRHFDVRARDLRGDPDVNGVVLTLRDVTDAAEARTQLEVRERTYRLLFDRNPQPMWVFDVDSLRFVEANDAMVAHYGWTREELAGMTVLDIRPESERDRFVAETSHLDGTVRRAGVWRHVARDGRELLVDIVSTLLDGDDGRRRCLVLASDVTQQQRLEYELRQLAYRDGLTGLPNRAYLERRIVEALERDPVGTSLGLVDLDGFKAVNDALGHDVGDQLLVEVARRVAMCVRSEDVAARLGGDEFAILMPTAGAERVASRVVTALRAPIEIDGHQLLVTASVGVAAAAGRRETAASLLRNADLAMYEAKHAGKDRWEAFVPAMHHRVARRLELEADLRRAIAAEEFVLHYQPVVDLADDEVIAVEALVRWNHPTKGLLPPGEFVGVAEATGGILALGSWVLHEACRQVGEWNRLHVTAEPLRVSVNLSPRQLLDSGVVASVLAALRRTGLAPELLTLEITESILVEQGPAVMQHLTDLRAIGVTLSLDDFGTGYSSLSYLRQLPIQQLKVDKSFVGGIERGGADSTLLRAVVRIGRSLGLRTVAEGVETSEQAMLLRALRCEWAQGFHFAEPLAPPDIEALFARAAAGVAWARTAGIA